jgi:homoserine kinase
MIRILAPATTANLGPGFDALGLALDLHNAFEVAEADEFQLTAEGTGAGDVPSDPAHNLFVRAVQATREELGLAPLSGLRLRAEVTVPPSRGLGSSATATVAGVLAAHALLGREVDPALAVRVATRLEGHPDNVVPCLLGGLCVCARAADGQVVYGRALLPDPPQLVLLVPGDLELSTQAMREVLPAEVPFAHAVDNVGRVGLLVLALVQGRRDLLRVALNDNLHQPFRGPLIPGFEATRSAACEAGALGLVISGSGPTLLALTPPEVSEQVALAAVAAWAAAGVEARALTLAIDARGARLA